MCAESFPVGLLLRLLALFLFCPLSALASFECDGRQNLAEGQLKKFEREAKLTGQFICELSKKQQILEAIFGRAKKGSLRSDASLPFIASDQLRCLRRGRNLLRAKDPALSQLLNELFAAEMGAKRKLQSLEEFDNLSMLKELKKSVAFALVFLAKRHKIRLTEEHQKQQHFDLATEEHLRNVMEELNGFLDKAPNCHQNDGNCEIVHKNGRKGRAKDEQKFLRFAYKSLLQIDLNGTALSNGRKDEKRRRRRKRFNVSNIIVFAILAVFMVAILSLVIIACHNVLIFARNIERNNGQTEANGAMEKYMATFKGIPSVVVGAKALSEEGRTECAICLFPIEPGTKVRPLPICQHMFHNDCIEMWVQGGHNGCPICRREILSMDMLTTAPTHPQAADNNDNDNNNNSNGGTQNEVIIEIDEEAEANHAAAEQTAEAQQRQTVTASANANGTQNANDNTASANANGTQNANDNEQLTENDIV